MPSIFLIGPTPRSTSVLSWRPEAIKILQDIAFNGYVLVPERDNGWDGVDYLNQIEWEYACLRRCTVKAAWVPREMETMPALTTNVEFGYWISKTPDSFYYGRPDWASHTGYLDWLYLKETGRKPAETLEDLLINAICNSAI